MYKITYEDNLKNHFKNAKDTLLDWEGDIGKAEQQLDFLTKGDKHETVLQAFRDTVFFACDCMDDTKVAAETFGNLWEGAESRGNIYRQPINMVFVSSGVQSECIVGNDTLCRWAKNAEALHQLISKGTITRENLIDFIRRQGGIRGYYDRLTNRKKAKPIGGGGKGMSSSDADKNFNEDYNRLKNWQSGESDNDDTESEERHLVSIVIDISASRSFRNLNIVKNRFNPKDFPDVVSIQTIDEITLELINKGVEADA